MHKKCPNVNKLETFVLTFFLSIYASTKQAAIFELNMNFLILNPFAIKYILHIMVENVYEYIYIYEYIKIGYIF